MNDTELPVSRPPVYKRLWFRLTALLLALLLVFSIWASGAIYIHIRPRSEDDAAAQYLIDNTDYIQQDELARLEGKLRSYFQATELVDFYQLAGTQIAAGEYAEALNSIGECLERYTGTDPELYVDLMLKRGCLLVLLEQYPAAAEALEKVVEKDPGNADASLVLAQIYTEIGDVRNLAKVLGRYLEINPEDSELRMLHAQALFEAGVYPQAIEAYDHMIGLEDFSDSKDQLLFLKALSYVQMEEYQPAEEILQELYRQQISLSGLNYYLALCLLSMEKYADAETHLNQSIELEEMLQLSYYSRAVCRLMKINTDIRGAIQDLEFVTAYEGTDSDAEIVEQAESLLAALQQI